MGDRGFQSGEALSVAAVSLPGQRPQPMAELNDEQAEVWRRIVGRMPADWHTPENFDLLSSYCRHVVRARHYNVLLDKLQEEKSWSPEIRDLTAAIKGETQAMINLARQMRLTQLSRYVAARAATAVKNESAKQELWAKKVA